MAKNPKNHGKPWTAAQDSQLRKLAKVPQLKRLILVGTDVTQAGVETLQQERSDLEVIH